jgi:hypothetical protein
VTSKVWRSAQRSGGRFQVGGAHCETTVAAEEDVSADLSFSFYFRRESFNPARKRGTLVAGDTPTATALESRVSRLLLVISGSGVWDISSRRRQ